MPKQRKQINLQIIDLLRDYICKHPEQRFGQALRNIGIVDTENVQYESDDLEMQFYTNIFNEEPEITLNKIYDTLNKLDEE